jgi:hypothetical protein
MITKLLAAEIDWTSGVGAEYTPLTNITPTGFFQGIINLLLIGIVTACLIFLLIGGYQWIVSKGDKEGVSKSQKTISGALIGLVIALSIFMINGLLSSFIRANLTQICIPGVSGSSNCGVTYTSPAPPTPRPPTSTPAPPATTGAPGASNLLCPYTGYCGVIGVTYVQNSAPTNNCVTCESGGWGPLFGTSGIDCFAQPQIACPTPTP